MTITNQDMKQDDTKFERELESAKKRMTETRKEFGESMKLVT